LFLLLVVVAVQSAEAASPHIYFSVQGILLK